MTAHFLSQLKDITPRPQNSPLELQVNDTLKLRLYPNSVRFDGDEAFFIAKENGPKYLWVLRNAHQSSENFDGEVYSKDEVILLKCPLTHHNADLIRSRFEFTRPVLIGQDDSFGYGDRLGIANPAHIRIGRNYPMRPVLAQQSIRELQRTERSPEEVIDAATWAVLQEGYTAGFGADADHLKTTEDIDLMVRAGFTMFTIDPGEFVVNEADSLPLKQVEEKVQSLLCLLEDQVQSFVARYAEKKIDIADDFSLKPEHETVMRGLLKYGNVIAHTTKLYHYLKGAYPDHPSEVELSVDETDSVTSPFEHFLVANELKRREVKLVSLAPRFVGDFEKGIDYKGDLGRFKTEYLKHLKIAEKVGPYKISFHSGSDKFSVYETIASLKQGRVHVKTAGTSYLEALRTVAAVAPDLFREILDFSRALYEEQKETYHVSAELQHVRSGDQYTDEKLLSLFDQDDARQILHVNYGKVLTEQINGKPLFKQRLMACLAENEEKHYEFLMRHFTRHLAPFA